MWYSFKKDELLHDIEEPPKFFMIYGKDQSNDTTLLFISSDKNGIGAKLLSFSNTTYLVVNKSHLADMDTAYLQINYDQNMIVLEPLPPPKQSHFLWYIIAASVGLFLIVSYIVYWFVCKRKSHVEDEEEDEEFYDTEASFRECR